MIAMAATITAVEIPKYIGVLSGAASRAAGAGGAVVTPKAVCADELQ